LALESVTSTNSEIRGIDTISSILELEFMVS